MQLPLGAEALKAWLMNRWEEKEGVLESLKNNWDEGLARLRVQ